MMMIAAGHLANIEWAQVEGFARRDSVPSEELAALVFPANPENPKMRSLAQAFAAAVFVVSGTCTFGQTDYAHFWLSTSATDPLVGEVPEILISNEAPGTLYIWGRPRLTADSFVTLTNWSLNIVTKVDNLGAPKVDFLDDKIDVFNEELEPRRFEYDRDSTPQDCDPVDTTFCFVPGMRSEVQPIPASGTSPGPGVLPGHDAIKNMAGFTFRPSGATGIGGECQESDKCFVASPDGKPAWLVGSVGYQALTSGQTNVYLQIGKLGMNHEGESSDMTTVRFGLTTDPVYNASSQRECNFSDTRCTNVVSDMADAVITSSMSGDFDSDGDVDADDLTEWQTKYGDLDADLPGGNGNGIVDGGDFLIWQRHYTGAAPVSSSFAVPEPATSLALVSLAGLQTLLLRSVRSQGQIRGYVAQCPRQFGAVNFIKKRGPTRNLSYLSWGIILILASGVRVYAQDEVFWSPQFPIVADWDVDTNWDPVGVPNVADNEIATINNSFAIARVVVTDPPIPGILGLNLVNGQVMIQAGASLNVADLIDIAATGTLNVQGMLDAQSMQVEGMFTVGGMASVSDIQHTAGHIGVVPGGILSVGGYHKLGGDTLLLGDATLNGTTTELLAGFIEVSDPQGMDREGIIMGDVTVGPDGELRVLESGTVLLAGELTNFDSGSDTLSGGTYFTAGTLKISDANIVTNAANITLSGPGSEILDLSSNDALASFEINSSAGRFTLNDRDLLLGGDFTNAGDVTIRNSSILTINGTQTYTQSGGVTQLGSDAAAMDEGELVAASVHIQGGIFRGSGSVLGNVTNTATVAPGFSPGIIEVFGNYTQTSEGVLDIEIGGVTSAGEEFDQLQVMGGTADLAGRLDLSLIELEPGVGVFSPVAGQSVTIVTAASVVNRFDSMLFSNPPPLLAVRILYSTGVCSPNSVCVQFVPQLPVVEYDEASGGGNWDNMNDTDTIWKSDVLPNARTPVQLINPEPMPHQVNLVFNAFVDSLTIAGATDTMTLEVENGRSLSSTHFINVGANGVLQLNGGTAVSTDVSIDAGGMLRGEGTVVGTATNGGAISPGSFGITTGRIFVDGDATLTSGSSLVIDVTGTNSGEYDTLEVGGEVTLGGELMVDLTSSPIINVGDRVTILRAGSIAVDSTFEEIEITGSSGSEDVVMGTFATTVEVYVEGYPVGDMDMDFDRDSNDVPLFAMRLVDEDAYFLYLTERRCPAIGCSVTDTLLDGLPDVKADGQVDFDDVIKFADLLNTPLSEFVELMFSPSVPEPSSVLLLLTLCPLAGVSRKLPIRF